MKRAPRLFVVALACAAALLQRAALAEDEPPTVEPPPPAKKPSVTPLGYVEALYSWNFNHPSNGITGYRAFDNRHNTFTLSNVVLGAAWEADELSGRAVLQVGHTPSSYYAAEPGSPASAGANASGAELFKYVQEAFVTYKPKAVEELTVQLGLFASPIGPEVIPVKDNWNWSRSNLFFALPFYHAGLRATLQLSSEFTAGLAIYNGWNNVVDNNQAKSIAAHLAWKHDTLSFQGLYFGGIERSKGAPEGEYWRHDFDIYGQWDIVPAFSVLAHFNTGFEPNRFGTAAWTAGALYARVKATDWLYFAARADRFWESRASGPDGTSSSIFFPVKWVSSGTLTVDARPRDGLSVRLEYRHDQADGDIYFRGNLDAALTPNARSQDTLTLGATTWF